MQFSQDTLDHMKGDIESLLGYRITHIGVRDKVERPVLVIDFSEVLTYLDGSALTIYLSPLGLVMSKHWTDHGDHYEFMLKEVSGPETSARLIDSDGTVIIVNSFKRFRQVMDYHLIEKVIVTPEWWPVVTDLVKEYDKELRGNVPLIEVVS